MNYDRPELLDKLAAAYVFGTLTGRARRRFARLRQTLPAAEAAVVAWEVRTAGLARAVEPVTPSPQVWEAIEQRIGAAQPASVKRRRQWWQPAFGFAFGVCAMVVLLRLQPPGLDVLVPPSEAPTKGYVGILVDAAGVPTVLASSARHGRELFVTIKRPLEVPVGKVLQLWAVPDNAPPFPLATVPAEGKTVVQMAGTSEELLKDVSRLAVSVEDAAAQAGGAPSAFVVSGNCVKLW